MNDVFLKFDHRKALAAFAVVREPETPAETFS